MEPKTQQLYTEILKHELIMALGCTEPIAVAYAAAKAREVLGKMPEKLLAQCSGNIIKNIKGVVVPATGGLRGIAISALNGLSAGHRQRLHPYGSGGHGIHRCYHPEHDDRQGVSLPRWCSFRKQ